MNFSLKYGVSSTASRYLSLFDVNGADDFFSSDLTNDELTERLGHIGRLGEKTGLRLLAAYSNKDEYVPPQLDKDALLKRLVAAMNNGEQDGAAEGLLLQNANHNLSDGSGDSKVFVQAVGDIMRTFKRID